MTVKRMDNVGIVVEDIDAAIEFFTELGLELEGRAPIEGDWRTASPDCASMRVEIAMMRTPDGHSRLELSRFLAPPVVADHRTPRELLSATCASCSPWRTSTIRSPDSSNAARARRRSGPVRDIYRLCYIRGPKDSHRARPAARQQTSRANADETVRIENWSRSGSSVLCALVPSGTSTHATNDATCSGHREVEYTRQPCPITYQASLQTALSPAVWIGRYLERRPQGTSGPAVAG
jgi:hypothetical protein